MSLRTLVWFLVVLFACGTSVSAQKGRKSGAAPDANGSPAPSGQPSQEPSSPALGFSIETEMFTYKAVRENSAIIACDVARFLYASDINTAPPDAHVPCMISNPAQMTPGIVIVSSGSTLLADLQVWRTDMDFMGELEARADKLCKPSAHAVSPQAPGDGNQPNQSAATAKGFAVIGSGQSLISIAMQALTHNESISSVGGTVRDNALMNEVARQLRSLRVQVVIPEIYGISDSMKNAESSPYFAKFEELSSKERECQQDATTYAAGDSGKTPITNLTNDIQNFGKALSSTETEKGQSEASAPSHLATVLSADRIARKLFAQETAGHPNPWQYILWLQALESGGSVLHSTSFFGTKISFSGGAVDTYGLYHSDGELACSGNVFDFQSPIRTKHLDKSFRKKPSFDPAVALELQSTCPLRQ